MVIKIKVPNKNYEGVIAGVLFTRGEAIFENEDLAKRIADDLGYALVCEAKPEPVEEPKQKKWGLKNKGAGIYGGKH